LKLLEFFSKTRVLTATIFIAISIAAALIGGWLFAAYMLILVFVGIDEFIKLFNAKGCYPSRVFIYLFNALYFIAAFLGQPAYFTIITVFMVILVFVSYLFTSRKVSINDITATIFGILYTGLLPVYFLLLRNMTEAGPDPTLPLLAAGAGYLLLTLMTIWASDIGAYFIGKKFGKRLLCPVISPKKTIEGAIGGTLSGIIIAVLMSFITDLNIIHSFVIGIIIVIAAQLGDLCESLIKRDAGVKDSGDIVPGHGGILDRADSYIFTGAVVYYYLKLVVITGLF
jgi:phosphatidate cytidylyltransferase